MNDNLAIDAVNSFSSTFNYSTTVPHGETIEEMLQSTQYLESSPITFTYSFGGRRELIPGEVYQTYLDFMNKNKGLTALRSVLYPLFCQLVIYFRRYEETDKCKEFVEKYLSTIPQEYLQEVTQFVENEEFYERYASIFNMQHFILYCDEKTANVLVDFINEQYNSQLRALLTDSITIRIKRDVQKFSEIRFISPDKHSELSIISGTIPGCNLAVIPKSAPYIYAVLDGNNVVCLETEKHISKILYRHAAPITTICASSTGSLCVTADVSGVCRVWFKNGSRLLSDVMCPIWSSCFAPIGGVFALGYQDGTVRLFRSDNCSVFRAFVGHTKSIIAICFHPNCSYVASASLDSTIRLWDVRTAETKRLFIASQPPSAVAISPDGKNLAYFDGSLHLCDIGTGENKALVVLPLKFIAGIHFLASGTNAVVVAKGGAVFAVNFETQNATELTAVEKTVVFSGIPQENELRILTAE